jgi:hypothetical protein
MNPRNRTRRSPTHAPSGHEAALTWLARQLRWEHLLADLRGPDDEDLTAHR